MEESHKRFVPGPLIAAVFALALGSTTALGAVALRSQVEGIDPTFAPGPSGAGNAMQWPAFALAAGLTTALGGIGLLLRKRWGRALFLIAMPFAAIGLAGNHPAWLWDQDVPYTLVLALAYGPIAFLLSRPGAQENLGIDGRGFGARGGWIALALLVLVGAARTTIGAMEPRLGGPDVPGFDHIGWALSEYVAKLAVAEVLLAHFVLGFVAIALPVRWRRQRDAEPPALTVARGEPAPGLVRRWLLFSCLGAIVASLVGSALVELLMPLPPPDSEPGTWLELARPTFHFLVWGLVFGVAQAMALRRIGIRPLRWSLATSVGAAVGAALGAWVSWPQSPAYAAGEEHIVLLLVLQVSALQGLGIGLAQGIAGCGRARARIAWALSFTVAFSLSEWGSLFARSFVHLAPFSEAGTLSLRYMVHGFVASAVRGLLVALLTLPWLGELEASEVD